MIKSKENDRIFGGYTNIAWTIDGKGYKKGNGSSFIFSLKDDHSFLISKSLIKDHEVYHGSQGIAFGYDNLAVYGNCDKDDMSNS